jgi:hypothetical protein
MVKNVVRALVRTARTWLHENEAQPETMPQVEQYAPPIRWCAEILRQKPERPNYAWGVTHAAALAQALKIGHISVIELGVAGGNGLIALEEIAQRASELSGVDISIYGFDTGIGLPKPTDYRDLPNHFCEGSFPMDTEKLRRRLAKAKLILGLVEDTIPKFIDSNPPSIGFIAFDLDLYSSTKHALRLLEADERLLLPRVYCYFDDILGFTYSKFTGELLAISEFNDFHVMRKISKIKGMRYLVPTFCRPHCWVEQFYMAHIFDHKLYGEYDGSNPQTTLDLAPDAAIA